jgi:hypothetical protein
MARQEGVFPFTGKLGKVVGIRGKNNKFFIRTLPDITPEQRAKDPVYEPCRKAATKFGEHAHLGTYIRHCLAAYLELMADGKLNNRLVQKITDARKQMMKDTPDAPLDIRRIAPAFRRFSLREDFCLNEIAPFKPDWTPAEENDTVLLHIPKLVPKGSRWRKVNPEIIRWHLAYIPLPAVLGQDITHPNRFFFSEWMDIDAVEPLVFALPKPKPSDSPALVALGYEAAQGNAELFYSLRTLGAMEILDIL